MKERCDNTEELANRDVQIMYERVKEGEGEAIMKKNGEMAIEKHEVLGRWKEYI